MTAPGNARRLEDSDLVVSLAKAANLSPGEFLGAVKRQITAKKDEITVSDMIALFVTAQQYGLNPLRREVSLIDTKQGPRVYVTFDGWLRVLVSHPQYVSHRWVYHWSGDGPGKGTCDAITFVIRRRVVDGTIEEFQHTELLRECMNVADWSPWKKWPSRMLAEKAAMQGTRFCFAMYVPDLDDVRQAEEFEAQAERAETAAPAPGHVGPVVPIERSLPAPAERIEIRFTPGCTAAPVTDPAAGRDEDAMAAAGAPGATDRAKLPATPRTAPATLPGFDVEESRRVDAEIAAREGSSGFEDLDLD